MSRPAPPVESKPQPARGRTIWQILGPGLITGASDDDPSGIATYSQVGAQLGTGMAWTMLFSFPLMAAIQEICARIGVVTGNGIAGNIRRYYPPYLLQGAVLVLLAANIINLGADLGAMADSLRLLAGGPRLAYVVGFGVLCVGLEVFMQYRRYVSLLKWSTIALFAYVATALTVKIDWSGVIRDTFMPSFRFDSAYTLAIVAVFGTTISPYLFFWQSSQEAEDEQQNGVGPLLLTPLLAPKELRRIRVDTYLGMFFSNVIGWFIIIAVAATLHAHGITNIATTAEAAQALRPIAGPFAFGLFALGVIGTGMLAVPVLAGSAAYALAEALQWPAGLARLPLDAKAFYTTIGVATALGVLMNITPIDPIKALFWAAVLNGICAVPLMGITMLMARNRRVMGNFTLPRSLTIAGWVATAVMAAVVVAMFATWSE
ncbi:MAG: divalent metal cation transporter [Alphaproteobacteria bacterium]|nr:divalent metal cation transporter [Alphaproteobacteria bacterium]